GGVRWHKACALYLAAHVSADIASRGPVEKMLALQPIETIGGVQLVSQRAHELTLSQAEVVAAAGALAVPERDHGRRPFGRDNRYAIDADVGNAPGVRTQEESVADATFPHELFVDLANAQPLGRHHGKLAGIRDRAPA